MHAETRAQVLALVPVSVETVVATVVTTVAATVTATLAILADAEKHALFLPLKIFPCLFCFRRIGSLLLSKGVDANFSLFSLL